MTALVGATALVVDVVLILAGVLAVIVYHCQRKTHSITDRDRFAQMWADEAHQHPEEVVHTVDDAVDWLASNVEEILSRQHDTQAARIRSGFDDERWEDAQDQWRASLTRGQVAGRCTRNGDGWITHTHVYPVETP